MFPQLFQSVGHFNITVFTTQPSLLITDLVPFRRITCCCAVTFSANKGEELHCLYAYTQSMRNFNKKKHFNYYNKIKKLYLIAYKNSLLLQLHYIAAIDATSFTFKLEM